MGYMITTTHYTQALSRKQQAGTNMKMNHFNSKGVVLFSLFMIAEPVFAYLDPGTGGMLIQIILGGVAGLAVAGKLFWNQLKSFFRFGKSDDANDA